jgi:hypothetical protein
MSVPPELMALLQGGNADAGYPAPDVGYAPPETQDQGSSAEELLSQGIEILQAALQAEPDPQDSQAIAEIVKQLYAILGTRQKESDEALQGKMNPRMLRRGV